MESLAVLDGSGVKLFGSEMEPLISVCPSYQFKICSRVEYELFPGQSMMTMFCEDSTVVDRDELGRGWENVGVLLWGRDSKVMIPQ